MKSGDILFPIIRENISTGQLALPLFGSSPCVLIERKLYISDDENDCQSEGIQDWRWVVLQDGNMLWMTEHLLGEFFEYR
tara:strand:+ start:699 stop:938 length:240 start_codon:yes stop_codon:yes gene_type:complete